MADFKPEEALEVRRRDEFFKVGGLEFVISNNDYGANMAVFGEVRGKRVEIVRFQDYFDDPHYHAPVGGWIKFERSELGEPLEWWIGQLRDHLPELLTSSGFADLLPDIDFVEIAENVDALRQAMIDCVPGNYTRVPGEGIRRIDWSEDEATYQKRNELDLEFGGLRFEILFDRDLGATMEVFREIEGKKVGLIRLDDYDENPHYHAPVGAWFPFDRAALGEPLAWFIAQVRDNLPELLERSRAGEIVKDLDLKAISAAADSLYDAMAARLPRGCVRIPGEGLRRVDEVA